MIKKTIKNLIPIKIRPISLSLAVFMLGRGLGTDTYFSIYVKEIIGNERGVAIIGAILAAVRLIFVIPIGRMNDHINTKSILLVGKFLFVLCGLFFFLAGIYHSWFLLTIAIIINGFANAITVTSYRSYYAKKASKKDNSQVMGVYFSATYITEVIGSLIAAFLVKYLDLPYMYFFVVIFSLVSLVNEQNINLDTSNKYNQTWNRFYKRVKKESLKAEGIVSTQKYIKSLFGKKGFIRSFFKECLSRDSWIEIWKILHKYGGEMYVALGSLMLTNMLNYTSYLFIPIVAAENNFSLSKIAIVYAVMKLPYVINVFTGKIGDKYSKKLLISIVLVSLSFLYLALGFVDGFYTILILTFFTSLGIALLFPLSSALVISYTQQKDKGSMTGVQDFVGSLGSVLSSLLFGILSAMIGLKKSFIILGLCTFGLGIYLMIKKLVSYKKKPQEHIQEKINPDDVYDFQLQ